MYKTKDKKKYIKKGGATEQVVTQPVVTQQVIDKTSVNKPVNTQSVIDKTSVNKPVITQQVTDKTGVTQPVITQQVIDKTGVNKPVVTQQVIDKTGVNKPVVTQSVVTQPVINQQKNKKNNTQPFVSNAICLVHNPILLKNNKEFPLFEYEGGDGFKTVKIILKQNEKIRADAGAMNYMSSAIKVETTSGSFFGAIGRLFSGSSFFYNIFYNETSIPRDITLSGVIPGSVGCFYIPNGKSFNLVADSYICSTPNLEITTNVRFGGFLLGYGLTFVNVSAQNGHGLIWSSSFGDVIEKIIEPGHAIKIDNGILLGFEAHINIQTQSVGGLKSTLFSGEGFVSEIKNTDNYPMRIFLQSRSKTAFINYIIDITGAKR